MGGHNNWPYIMNLGNSIIGVAVLAMPFCFQQCGILLGMLVLLFCTWLTLVSCRMLLKAGVSSRRRSYEFLAYHTHGAPGKFITEVGMIGMQFGTLIAQMVVIGDLGPSIVATFFGLQNVSGLRTGLIILLCLTIGLPMGLLKDLRAVSRASTVCILCYSVYVVYVLCLSMPSLWKGDWISHVYFWRTQGLFRCLPIFSFSFGCQTQLFILYDALPEPSLKTITSVTTSAVNLCAVVYLLVGFLGYITFYSQDIPGDIINIFPRTFFTDITKLAFVGSTVITFPVIIFPCRASIYTLLFAKTNQNESCDQFSHDKSKHHDDVMSSTSMMPENLFKIITVCLVVVSMAVAILIPNVEFILGINGAVMGTLICYIFPAMFFLKVLGSKPEERSKAQLVLVFGVTILLVSTVATLSSHKAGGHVVEPLKPPDVMEVKPLDLPVKPVDVAVKPVDLEVKPADVEIKPVDSEVVMTTKIIEPAHIDKRQEPPNPDPPDKEPVNKDVKKAAEVDKNILENEIKAPLEEKIQNLEDKGSDSKAKELEKERKQEDLLAKLELQRQEQEKLIEEQKELLKQFKEHHVQDMLNSQGHQNAGQQNNQPPIQDHQPQLNQKPVLNVDQPQEIIQPRLLQDNQSNNQQLPVQQPLENQQQNHVSVAQKIEPGVPKQNMLEAQQIPDISHTGPQVIKDTDLHPANEVRTSAPDMDGKLNQPAPEVQQQDIAKQADIPEDDSLRLKRNAVNAPPTPNMVLQNNEADIRQAIKNDLINVESADSNVKVGNSISKV
ncbi:putative sodium-coupled neutral amino acid transporter 10 isoform X2 [Physella acuta]|uniref:putative sodium-coupled neutral amino acid transporter 10 isoform X2 n=1 Tax=Physella acuta TaxID=109671 RepID=UPI0027DC4CB3|nr:putative sodium-coupled neutral amino acid transporter 10 isoform X2 [Physella acuta]